MIDRRVAGQRVIGQGVDFVGSNIGPFEPLVGRDPELRALRAAIQRAESRVANAIVLEGEPGIGKTRLVTETQNLATSRGWLTLRCHSSDLDIENPFVAVSSGLDDLVAHLASDSPGELIDALALLRKPITSRNESLGDQIAALLVAGLNEASTVRPLLVVFEDAHWLDEASARVFWGLVRGRRSASVLTLATFRPSERETILSLRRALDSQGVSTFVLGSLSPTHAEALATEILQAPISPASRLLLNDAGGNPLFITELMRGAAELADTTGSNSADAIPTSLRSLVLRRLNGFSPSTRDLLFDASLLGVTFDVRILAKLRSTDVAAVADSLLEPIQQGLLDAQTDTLRFRHAVVQTIVAESRIAMHRCIRHREIAQLLAQLDYSATKVAEHHWKSSPLQSDEASEWMHRAANESKRLSLETSLSWLERSIACLGDGLRSFDLQMEKATCLVLTGRLVEAEAICQTVEPLVTNPDEAMRVRITQTALTSMAGRTRQDEALANVDWILESLDATDIRRVEMLGWKALLLVFRGDLLGAETCAHEALACRFDGRPAEIGVSRPYEALGLAALLRGDIANAIRYTEKATETYEHHGNVFTTIMTPHFARAMTLLASRPISEVIAVVEEGYASCDRAGHELARLHLDPVMAIAHFVSGDTTSAQGLVGRVLHRADDWRTGGVSLPTITGLGAYLALLRDDLDSARTLAAKALEELLVGGAQAGSADFVILCIAMVTEADGREAEARELYRGIWELFARDASLFSVAPDLVRLTRTTDADFALDVVTRVEARSSLSGATLDRAHALACRGHYEARPDLLEAAAVVWDEGGWKLAAAVVRTSALLNYEKKFAARELESALSKVLLSWAQLEQPRPVRLLRDKFPQQSKQVKVERPVSGPGSLTQSEKAVARLVADGMTNKQIAQRLNVSHRTVDTHVSHALAKLGLTSRVLLASFMAQNR